MKKIVFALATLAVVSCKQEDAKPVDYTLISGKITNKVNDKLTIIQGRNKIKEIAVDENGMFSDTLRVNEGNYTIHDNNQAASIYIKTGDHFNMTVDTEDFDKSLAFTGEGSQANQLFAKITLLQEELDYESLIGGSQENFDSGLAKFKADYTALLEGGKALIDSTTLANQHKTIEGISGQFTQMYAAKVKMKAMIGQPSASFDYENHKGGTTALADLKGKYVYIDMWATWCGPCKREIPFLKEVEEKYHGKNIEFVSISVDKNKEAWTKMVTEKNLGGIQLHSGDDREFSKAYEITGIPRFILLDPNGNIVDADAPRPSSPKLIELFTERGI
ncbi:MAG: TlpA family protein disulfide reductase [Flavobacteriaceae bacterium]